jgi:protein-disulfide isomerase
MYMRLAGTIGSLTALVIGSPTARAAPASTMATAAVPPAGLSAKQHKLVDELLATSHPYECCSDTLAACLKARPVCALATRLEHAITHMVAAGLGKSEIEAALAHRQATMKAEQPRAKLALDDRFKAGTATSTVVLAVYACPRQESCAKLVPELYREVTAGRLKDKVVLHYRPFFPANNDEALECGRGLYAAAYQGKFWPYLLHLCMERENIDKPTLRDWVGSHGLDRCIFDQTCEQPGTAAWLKSAREEGLANGVTAAPAAFVNGRRIQGRLDLETLVDLLEEEHERLARSPATGASPAKPAAEAAPANKRRPARRAQQINPPR